MLLTGFVLIVLTLSIGVDLAGMCLIPLALAALRLGWSALWVLTHGSHHWCLASSLPKALGIRNQQLPVFLTGHQLRGKAQHHLLAARDHHRYTIGIEPVFAAVPMNLLLLVLHRGGSFGMRALNASRDALQLPGRGGSFHPLRTGLLALRGFTHSSLPRLFMPAGFVELPA